VCQALCEVWGFNKKHRVLCSSEGIHVNKEAVTVLLGGKEGAPEK
jgi:hypothetical protein